MSQTMLLRHVPPSEPAGWGRHPEGWPGRRRTGRTGRAGTPHRWTTTPEGVVQVVVADDPADARQIGLVREHLRSEAGRFARGDFTDPAAIHGDDMPGLEALRGHGGRIAVAYRELDAGAELAFTTSDRELVEALQRWAEAQPADHGPHAEH